MSNREAIVSWEKGGSEWRVERGDDKYYLIPAPPTPPPVSSVGVKQ